MDDRPSEPSGREAVLERVRLGMIGCGNMGRYHGRLLTQTVPEAEICALADSDPNNLASFIADVFPDGKQLEGTFTDYRQMLETVPLDGVVIVSPHAYHFQHAMDAISAGCHVLIEKPMVIKTEDAQTLIRHARNEGRLISVAFQGPFSREFQYIRNIVATGQLGEISLVTGVCTQHWIEAVRDTWRTQPELSGGGNLYDSGAHMFNAMLYLTGLAATDVFAFIENKGENVDVVSSVSLRLNSGALGTAAVTGDASVMEEGIYIQGTQGAAKVSIYGGGKLEHWQGKELVKYPVVPPTPSVQQNFVDCIRGRATTPSPALLGLRLARLMDAIYESGRTGRVVQVVADAGEE